MNGKITTEYTEEKQGGKELSVSFVPFDTAFGGMVFLPCLPAGRRKGRKVHAEDAKYTSVRLKPFGWAKEAEVFKKDNHGGRRETSRRTPS